MSFLPDFRAKNILRPKVLENNNYFKSAVNEALISSKVFQKTSAPSDRLTSDIRKSGIFRETPKFLAPSFCTN